MAKKGDGSLSKPIAEAERTAKDRFIPPQPGRQTPAPIGTVKTSNVSISDAQKLADDAFKVHQK